MATQTTNLGLVKPELQDNFNLKEHINDNLDKIDTAINENDNKLFPKETSLLSISDYSITSDGITVSVNDGLISVLGTLTKATKQINIPVAFPVEKNEYTFSLQNYNFNKDKHPTIFFINKSGVQLKYGTEEKKVSLYYNTASLKGTEISFTTSAKFECTKIALVLQAGEYDCSFNIQANTGLHKKLAYSQNPLPKYISYNENEIYASYFGAKGDGINDDTMALQAAINYAFSTGKALKLDSGKTYLISQSLIFHGTHLNFNGNGSTIKVSSTAKQVEKSEDNTCVCNYRIKYIIDIDVNADFDTTEKSKSSYYRRTFENVVLDCNGLAFGAIYGNSAGKTVFRDIMIINPITFGVKIDNGNELLLSNIHGIRRDVNTRCKYETYYKDTEGVTKKVGFNHRSAFIYLSCSDNYVENCVAIDFERGFVTGGTDNHFTRCHTWNCQNVDTIMKYSISFDVLGGYSTYNQCTIDSTKYGFYLHKNARVMINNCVSAYSSIYVNNFNKLDKPFLFYFDNETGYTTEKHINKGSDVVISSSYFKLANLASGQGYFDNLTINDEKILIDKQFDYSWDYMHIIDIEKTLRNS